MANTAVSAGFLLWATCDAAFPWLEKGCNYLRKDSSAIHRFDSMGPVNGIFVVRGLRGTEPKVEVPHDELKHFRSTDKEMPCKIDDGVVSKLSLASCPAWAMEKKRQKFKQLFWTIV